MPNQFGSPKLSSRRLEALEAQRKSVAIRPILVDANTGGKIVHAPTRLVEDPRGRCLTASAMRLAIVFGFSCSHARITSHPLHSSKLLVCRSRYAFAEIFLVHQLAFRLGACQCSGHWCQKQPSINTAVFADRNTISALRDRSASGRQSIRYRSPHEYNRRRTASSQAVSVWRCLRIRRAVERSEGAGARLPRLILSALGSERSWCERGRSRSHCCRQSFAAGLPPTSSPSLSGDAVRQSSRFLLHTRGRPCFRPA